MAWSPNLYYIYLYYIFTITFRFRSDNNEDNTPEILRTWSGLVSLQYHHIDMEIQKNSSKRPNETSPTSWPIERHVTIIDLKEKGLNYAREIWADYVFVGFMF